MISSLFLGRLLDLSRSERAYKVMKVDDKSIPTTETPFPFILSFTCVLSFWPYAFVHPDVVDRDVHACSSRRADDKCAWP